MLCYDMEDVLVSNQVFNGDDEVNDISGHPSSSLVPALNWVDYVGSE